MSLFFSCVSDQNDLNRQTTDFLLFGINVEFLVECLLNIFSFLCIGHAVDEVPEMPLVVSDKIQEYKKTKQAVALLRRVRAWADVEKVNNSTLGKCQLPALMVNICMTGVQVEAHEGRQR